MALQGIVHMAQNAFQRFVKPGDSVVDATLGAGYDTLSLAKLVGKSGHVYGFDVQEEAIRRSRENIQKADPNGKSNLEKRITLFQQGHETMAETLPKAVHGQVKAVSFNLGYLPASESKVTTEAKTSLVAIETAMDLLHPKGLIAIAIYSGHPQGQEEQHLIKKWALEQDYYTWRIASYEFMNKTQNQETLLLMERAK